MLEEYWSTRVCYGYGPYLLTGALIALLLVVVGLTTLLETATTQMHLHQPLPPPPTTTTTTTTTTIKKHPMKREGPYVWEEEHVIPPSLQSWVAFPTGEKM